MRVYLNQSDSPPCVYLNNSRQYDRPKIFHELQISFTRTIAILRDVIFLWLQRLKDLIKLCGFDCNEFLGSQLSLDWLKNTSKPRKMLSPPTVYALSPNVKHVEKRMFDNFASFSKFFLITHHARLTT